MKELAVQDTIYSEDAEVAIVEAIEESLDSTRTSRRQVVGIRVDVGIKLRKGVIGIHHGQKKSTVLRSERRVELEGSQRERHGSLK